jgi:hypothetical protein
MDQKIESVCKIYRNLKFGSNKKKSTGQRTRGTFEDDTWQWQMMTGGSGTRLWIGHMAGSVADWD